MGKHSRNYVPRMGKHSRNYVPRNKVTGHVALGHGRSPLGLHYRHCSYEPEPIPWLLMGEDYDDISEALEYDPMDDDDDDGDHRRPSRVR